MDFGRVSINRIGQQSSSAIYLYRIMDKIQKRPSDRQKIYFVTYFLAYKKGLFYNLTLIGQQCSKTHLFPSRTQLCKQKNSRVSTCCN